MASALLPAGLLIFDAIVEGGATPMTYRTWRSARDRLVLADVTEDLRRHVVSRRITTFVRTGSTWRRSWVARRIVVHAQLAGD